MEVEIIKQDKNEAEVRVDNLTIAEVLRVYLNEQGVEFVAWRRDHPSKPAILRIQTSGKTVKKVISDAISKINKDCDSIVKVLKKN